MLGWERWEGYKTFTRDARRHKKFRAVGPFKKRGPVRLPHGHRIQAWWAMGHPHETGSVPEEHGTSLVGKARVGFYVKHNAVIMTRRGPPARDLDE
jgi:hypothetical protein